MPVSYHGLMHKHNFASTLPTKASNTVGLIKLFYIISFIMWQWMVNFCNRSAISNYYVQLRCLSDLRFELCFFKQLFENLLHQLHSRMFFSKLENLRWEISLRQKGCFYRWPHVDRCKNFVSSSDTNY